MIASLPLGDQMVHALASTIVHFLWQATLLGALAWSVLHVLAPPSAQVRYSIQCGLMLLLLLCPLATLLTLSDASARSGITMPDVQTTLSPYAGVPQSALAVNASAAPRQRVDVVLRAWLIRSQSWLVAAWLAGVVFFAVRLALGAIGVWRITRGRQPLPEDLQLVVQRLVKRMSFRTRPAVYVAERISQALAVGVIRPMVLLPAAWVWELQPEMLEAVLAHELAHLRRWDLPINLLQRVVETALFFHPVVWWCSRRMRIERELCCDQWAAWATGDRLVYVEALTFLAARQGPVWEPMLAAGIGGSKMVLLERVRNVLGISRRVHGRFYGPTCALVGAAAASLAWFLVMYATCENNYVAALDKPSAPPTGIVNKWPDWTGAATPLSAAEKAALPSEKNMVRLPEYTIEPPDILFIEAIRVVPKSPYKIQSADTLTIQLQGGFPTPPTGSGPNHNEYSVRPSGRIDLGPAYGEAGRVQVAGLTEDEAAHAVEESLRQVVKDPQVSVQLAQSAGMQPITGEHLVAPDGTVNLGTYGRVYLAGLKLDEARAAIERHLAEFLDKPQVSLNVFAYNSKVYYVVTEGDGLGDTVYRFPVTGNETVLDALAETNGLSNLSNKRIWIARPSPGTEARDLILPVDWKEITAGATGQNYQVLPGDRIFVSARR